MTEPRGSLRQAPELYWSASLAEEANDTSDGLLERYGGQLYRQQDATWIVWRGELPADAVPMLANWKKDEA